MASAPIIALFNTQNVTVQNHEINFLTFAMVKGDKILSGGIFVSNCTNISLSYNIVVDLTVYPISHNIIIYFYCVIALLYINIILALN